MTEAQIQSAVVEHWKAFGLPGTFVAAVPNARSFGQAGLTKGLFDLVVMGGPFLRDRTGWLELKTAKGKISAEQEAFKLLCASAGTDLQSTLDAKEPLGKLAGLTTYTSSHTAVLGNAGFVVEMDVASANDFTIPPNSSVPFPIAIRIGRPRANSRSRQ